MQGVTDTQRSVRAWSPLSADLANLLMPIDDMPKPYWHEVERGSVLFLPSRRVCRERAASVLGFLRMTPPARDVTMRIASLNRGAPMPPRSMVFSHPVIVLGWEQGPAPGWDSDRIVVATLTRTADPRYGAYAYLPVGPGGIIEPPGMMRGGGYLFVGEIYTVPWYSLEINNPERLTETGERGIKLDPASIEYVRRWLYSLYGPQTWTL